jgi:hypothetical protein
MPPKTTQPQTNIYDTYDRVLYRKGGPLSSEDVRRIIPSSLDDGYSGGNKELIQGTFQSGNFLTRVRGWQLSSSSAEFQTAIFNIGGTVITINNTQDIQTNIDLIDSYGGGTLYLQNGTYTLTADITIPSGVTIAGVARDTVIIECGNYKLQIVGSNAYNTGTVTIANGGTTVVGVGTTWTSAMVGRYIYLGKYGDFFWYEITGFTDTTHITIREPYTGQTDLAGDTYTIATIVRDARINRLTVQNATGVAIKFQYIVECSLNDINVFGSGTGLDFDQALFPLMVISVIGCGVNVDWNEVSGFEINFSIFSDSTSGAGMVFTSTGNATFFDSGIVGNFGDGLNMTSCSSISFLSMDVSSNGGQGIELVSDCSRNSFFAVNMNNNTSDGIKFTATTDNNSINSCVIADNGGWGINIAAATCDNNILIGVNASGNASGSLTDSGTGTLKSAAVNIIP